METVATWFGYGKPTPKEQLRNVKNIITHNQNILNRMESSLNRMEKNLQAQIKNSNRDARNPTLAKPARQAMRDYALMIKRNRRNLDKIATAKATLQSVYTGAIIATSMAEMQEAVTAGVKAMMDENKDNKLTLSQANIIATNLANEQFKQETIEEFISSVLPEDLGEEDEEDAAVDQILEEILPVRMATSKVPTTAPAVQEPVVVAPPEEEQEEQQEDETNEALREVLDQRLQALRS